MEYNQAVSRQLKHWPRLARWGVGSFAPPSHAPFLPTTAFPFFRDRHIMVRQWLFYSSFQCWPERRLLWLYKQKALYSSWSLSHKPWGTECCGRYRWKFEQSPFRSRKHPLGRCDMWTTFSTFWLYRWWLFMLPWRYLANAQRLCQWPWVMVLHKDPHL